MRGPVPIELASPSSAAGAAPSPHGRRATGYVKAGVIGIAPPVLAAESAKQELLIARWCQKTAGIAPHQALYVGSAQTVIGKCQGHFGERENVFRSLT